MFDIFKGHSKLTLFATVLIILYGVYYVPIDSFGMNAPIKMALMVSSIIVMFFFSFKASKAVLIGFIYLLYQYIVASYHAESFRWGTYIYSVLLVLTYMSFYNLVFIEKVFKIEHFIRICKWIITLYFIFCVIQQVLIIMGITYMPIVNLMLSLDRGLGCQSLSVEPSHFGRFMLVFYYAYIKCQEYKRDEGPFTLRELFSGEHKWVSIMFLWMMLTMGSGTAFVCLILFSLYFVRWHNWYYVIPIFCISYALIQASGIEHLDRATSVINATTTLDKEKINEADGSAAARISPIVNSINADFSKKETWFGYGIDYSSNKKAFTRQTGTLFDDYGFIFYIVSLIFAFSCAYNFWSLGCIFMFAGVGGGFGVNIQYVWELAMVMTCVRYFYENRYNPDIYEKEDEEETSLESSPIKKEQLEQIL